MISCPVIPFFSQETKWKTNPTLLQPALQHRGPLCKIFCFSNPFSLTWLFTLPAGRPLEKVNDLPTSADGTTDSAKLALSQECEEWKKYKKPLGGWQFFRYAQRKDMKNDELRIKNKK